LDYGNTLLEFFSSLLQPFPHLHHSSADAALRLVEVLLNIIPGRPFSLKSVDHSHAHLNLLPLLLAQEFSNRPLSAPVPLTFKAHRYLERIIILHITASRRRYDSLFVDIAHIKSMLHCVSMRSAHRSRLLSYVFIDRRLTVKCEGSMLTQVAIVLLLTLVVR
jgi:hypothetical protein